jgi:hypothetical protein
VAPFSLLRLDPNAVARLFCFRVVVVPSINYAAPAGLGRIVPQITFTPAFSLIRRLARPVQKVIFELIRDLA